MKKVWIVFNRGRFVCVHQTKRGADNYKKQYGNSIGSEITMKQVYLYD